MDYKDKQNESFFEDSKEYLHTQINLLKLESVEKLTRIITVVLLLMLLVVLLAGTLFYLSFGFIWWSRHILGGGDILPGILIVSAFYMLLLIFIYLFKKQIIINPMVKLFSGIFFTNITVEEDEEE